MTHKRKSAHALTLFKKLSVFVSCHCTPTSKYQPLTREGCEPTVERPVERPFRARLRLSANPLLMLINYCQDSLKTRSEKLA